MLPNFIYSLFRVLQTLLLCMCAIIIILILPYVYFVFPLISLNLSTAETMLSGNSSLCLKLDCTFEEGKKCGKDHKALLFL